MTTSAADNIIDVALWFMDRARRDDIYLQPQKLQRLLYISYGSYGALNHGRELMPAYFIAGEAGPLDPNIFRLFERGRPDNLGEAYLKPEVENFLDSIWRRYGHHSTDYLNDQIKHHAPYQDAYKQGIGTAISYRRIVGFFTGQEKRSVQLVQTADGRKLQKWTPAALGGVRGGVPGDVPGGGTDDGAMGNDGDT